MDDLIPDNMEPVAVPGLAALQNSRDGARQDHVPRPPLGQSTRTDTALVSFAIAIAAMSLWAWWSTRSLSAKVSLQCQQAGQINADAARIVQLRDIPQSIRESDASESWLLERVTKAMQDAGLATQQLVSTAPQPSRSIDGSDLSEVTQSLELESISLAELTRFASALQDSKPLVRVSEIQLRARPNDTNWNAEVGVSCLAGPIRTQVPKRQLKVQELGI